MLTYRIINIPTDEFELNNLKNRFFKHIKKHDNCWMWIGCKINGGYGVFCVKDNSRLAHRVSYELFKGEIPKEFTIDHLCKNKACVNPEHLEAVTFKENLLRGNSASSINAKKTHCYKGHEFTPGNILFSKKGRHCKVCHYGNNEKYRKGHPEIIAQIKDNWYLRNKDQIKVNYENNKDKINQDRREARKMKKLGRILQLWY